MSGLAQAQLFSSDRVCKPRVAQPPVIQEGFFSGVPSGSGGYVDGRELRVDDDDDVYDNDNDLMIGICCGGSGRSVFCAVG